MKNNLVWYDVALIANKNATASFLSELGSMETFDIEDISNNKVFTTIEDLSLIHIFTDSFGLLRNFITCIRVMVI